MKTTTSTIAAALLAVLGVACSDNAAAPSEAPPETSDARPSADDGGATSDGGGVDASADAALSCKLTNHYGSPDCMACVADRCCAQVTACDADPACNDLQQCALDCVGAPDPAGCRDACFAQYPGARPLWTQVTDCWNGPTVCLKRCGWMPH